MTTQPTPDCTLPDGFRYVGIEDLAGWQAGTVFLMFNAESEDIEAWTISYWEPIGQGWKVESVDGDEADFLCYANVQAGPTRYPVVQVDASDLAPLLQAQIKKHLTVTPSFRAAVKAIGPWSLEFQGAVTAARQTEGPLSERELHAMHVAMHDGVTTPEQFAADVDRRRKVTDLAETQIRLHTPAIGRTA